MVEIGWKRVALVFQTGESSNQTVGQARTTLVILDIVHLCLYWSFARVCCSHPQTNLKCVIRVLEVVGQDT